MLSHASVVQPPDWTQPFHIFLDASGIAIDNTLMQRTPPDWFCRVYYTSRRLSHDEKNYSMTKKEALGMIYNIPKFRHYLLSRNFTFHVEHSALLYLVNNQALMGRLAQWMLLLQEFNFDIQHCPGVQYAVADYLSRLEIGEPSDQEYGDFLDVALFSINETSWESHSEDAWITEMMYFLSIGLPLEHLSLDAKKRFVVRSRNFCLYTDTLYHKGSDDISRHTVRQFEKDVVL